MGKLNDRLTAIMAFVMAVSGLVVVDINIYLYLTGATRLVEAKNIFLGIMGVVTGNAVLYILSRMARDQRLSMRPFRVLVIGIERPLISGRHRRPE